MQKIYSSFIKNLFWIRLLSISALTAVYLMPLFSPSGIQQELKIQFRIDYILHFLVFGYIGFVFLMRRSKRKRLLILLSFIAYSLIMETLQQLYFGRTFNPLDILANSVGLLGGLFMINYWNV